LEALTVDMPATGAKDEVNTAGSRWITVLIYTYFIGIVVVAIFSAVQAINNGGLDRHHDLRDWAIIALFYGSISLLWPVVALVVVLQLIGILPMLISW
jgi:hypothetical protein